MVALTSLVQVPTTFMQLQTDQAPATYPCLAPQVAEGKSPVETFDAHTCAHQKYGTVNLQSEYFTNGR